MNKTRTIFIFIIIMNCFVLVTGCSKGDEMSAVTDEQVMPAEVKEKAAEPLKVSQTSVAVPEKAAPTETAQKEIEAEYVGTKKCKMCHPKQYKSWKKTPMGNCFESLKPGVKAEAKKKAGIDPEKDYTDDPECLRCHTTGYGKPGGFKSLAETPKMIDVGCEGCHGPGGRYWKIMKKNKKFLLAEVKAAGLILPSEDDYGCLECHGEDSPFNEKLDPKYRFDIKERLKNTHEHFPLKYKH